MKRYLIPILMAILLLTPGLLGGCSQETDTSDPQIYREQVLEFVKAIRSIENDRITLTTERENFSEQLTDMPAATVNQEADDFVNRSSELRERLANIEVPEVEGALVVHTKFMVAYSVENQAYSEWRTAVQSADHDKLDDAEHLFHEAHHLLHQTYAWLNSLLNEFGLTWQDTE
jgi:uncharacterized protein YlxW (UPF0749 family)